MPLTTLSANIDYAFITMPLLNSIVSIKVWLFKSFLNRDVSMGCLSFQKLLRVSSLAFKDVFLKRLL